MLSSDVLYQYSNIFSKDRDFEQKLAHACDHAHVTLQWRSCACKLDRAIYLDLIIIVHYLGLLQCSPMVNADWIGSVLGALVRLRTRSCILCLWSGLQGRHLTVAMQSFWTCKTALSSLESLKQFASCPRYVKN